MQFKGIEAFREWVEVALQHNNKTFVSLQDFGRVRRKSFPGSEPLCQQHFHCLEELIFMDPPLAKASCKWALKEASRGHVLLAHRFWRSGFFLTEVTPFLLLILKPLWLLGHLSQPTSQGCLELQSLQVHAALGGCEAIYILLFYSHVKIKVFLRQKLCCDLCCYSQEFPLWFGLKALSGAVIFKQVSLCSLTYSQGVWKRELGKEQPVLVMALKLLGWQEWKLSGKSCAGKS